MQLFAILVILLNVGREVLGEEQDADFPSSLYLYDAAEHEHVFKKSERSIPEIEVVKAGMTGTGCFLLFEKENFDCLIHKVDWATQPLDKKVTVRSIKFLPEGCVNISTDYQCSRGSAILTNIGLVTLVLAILFSLFSCKV